MRDLTDKVQRARGIFFTDFKGLTVAEMTDLRRQCYQSHVDYLVCKNTFARRVLREQGYAEALKHLQGPTALAFGYRRSGGAGQDSARLRRQEREAGSEGRRVRRQGGHRPRTFRRSRICPAGRRRLRMLVAAIFGPVQGFYNVTTAVLRDFVSVIDQIIEQKKAAA